MEVQLAYKYIAHTLRYDQYSFILLTTQEVQEWHILCIVINSRTCQNDCDAKFTKTPKRSRRITLSLGSFTARISSETLNFYATQIKNTNFTASYFASGTAFVLPQISSVAKIPSATLKQNPHPLPFHLDLRQCFLTQNLTPDQIMYFENFSPDTPTTKSLFGQSSSCS